MNTIILTTDRFNSNVFVKTVQRAIDMAVNKSKDLAVKHHVQFNCGNEVVHIFAYKGFLAYHDQDAISESIKKEIGYDSIKFASDFILDENYETDELADEFID